MRTTTIALGFSVLLSSGASHANLIVNGSFEDSPSSITADGNYRDYGVWIRLKPGTSYLPGWTVSGIGSGGTLGVDWHYGTPTIGSPRPAQDGVRMIDLNIDGSGGQGPGQGAISQTFATVAGTAYNLSFYLAGPSSREQGGTLDPRTVVVDLTGLPAQTFTAAASSPAALAWEFESLGFTATGPVTRLTFSPLADTGQYGYWGAFLDNVSVVPANTVPAPTTLALLGVAAMCLGLGRRASRR